ncbi:MAG: class I tRNA ligase family protein, partial [Bacilli bacterium]|nr:class I tRNA ligase family protein [Bacilli bacterium]
VVGKPGLLEPIDEELQTFVLGVPSKVNELMEELRVADATSEIFHIFRRCNKYIDETMPWTLVSDPEKQERLMTVLYQLLESIRHGAVLLQAVLPDTAKEIFKQLNTENRYIDSLEDFNGFDSGIKLSQPEPLFVRIDKNKKLQEIEEYYKNLNRNH